MTNFFRYFIERHTFALVITFMFILLGLMTIPSIKRDTFPNVDLDEVVIITRYEGSSPEDIEQKITNKIEDKLKSIENIKQYSSISIENVSLIDIFIESDAPDPDKVKDTIREEIANIVDFPSDLQNRPEITEINSSTFPILDIGLSAPDLSYSELRAIAKSFKTDLEDIKGVGSIDAFGYRSREINIAPNPDLLNDYQVSILSLISVIQNRNLRASMGNLNQNNTETTIVNDSRFLTTADIENAIIRSNFNGKSVTISDVATVTDGFESISIDSRVLGEPGISFNIIKSESADIISLREKIDELINKYEKLYPNVTFTKASDFSKYLKNRLSVMITNGAIGLLLVIIVLTIFLNIEMAFWVSLGIPVAVMGVFFLMPPFDITINIISLLALIIVIGIIVDDGIIVAENIAKFREKGLSNVDASVEGIKTVFKPVFTTILTTIVAFSPMFFMTGIMGKFIFQIPLVISLALIISLIEVVIALPSHLSMKKTIASTNQSKRHAVVAKLRSRYETFLSKILNYKYAIVLFFIVLFGSSILYAKNFMDFVLFPESSAVTFYVKVEAPAGTTLSQTGNLIKPIEAALMNLPPKEILAFSTRIGLTGDAFFLAEQDNLGIIIVDLVPANQRDRTAREIMNQIQDDTKNVQGFNNISFQLDAGGPPVGKAINIRVITDNDQYRTSIANEVYNFTQAIDGVTSIDRDDKKQKPQLVIDFDYNKISRLGLNITQIQQTIRASFSGFIATTMRVGNEDLNYKVEINDSYKLDQSVLKNLLISNNTGRLIKLSDIAIITLTDGSSNYAHFDGKRSVTITGDIDKDIVTSTEVTNIVQQEFNSKNYPGVQFEFGGESEETNKSIQNLIRSFVVALIGIFLLLVLLFNSFTQPFLVILTIPFGLIGVIIAFALHGQDLGFISMVGTVGLTGVVVNDSLVLVNHLNDKLKKPTMTESIKDLVVIGSGDRFKPILITSCTTVAGLLPLAYGIGGADLFIAPMALAIGYGLLFSTPLTLFLLPALYLILIDIQSRFGKKQHPH